MEGQPVDLDGMTQDRYHFQRQSPRVVPIYSDGSSPSPLSPTPSEADHSQPRLNRVLNHQGILNAHLALQRINASPPPDTTTVADTPPASLPRYTFEHHRFPLSAYNNLPQPGSFPGSYAARTARPWTNLTPAHMNNKIGVIGSSVSRPLPMGARSRQNGNPTTKKAPLPSSSLRNCAILPPESSSSTEIQHLNNVLPQDNLLRGGDDSDSDCNHDDDEESKDEFKERLTIWIKQMMFVSGETTEPGPETTWMIEEIVREQVVEMLKEASNLANRRGSKSISIVDLIFQIRHNTAKVSRLKTFLSWKDVRKNVKDSDDKAGGADADALDLEDGGPMGANPAAPPKTQANKKAKLILPWEVQSYFSETVPEREDEEDEEEEEQNEATLARLASADERTKNMTKDEYVYWSDCRQASFTFRKGKRFREWAGFGTIIDSKPNDDVVDILGFLTFEIVQTLTEEALRVKNAEDLANKKAGRGDIEASKKRKREGCTLFEMPEEGRTPIEPRHVQEAFRRLQIVPKKYKFMRPGLAGIRTPLRMI